jgi:short-subunit dehydrogenase
MLSAKQGHILICSSCLAKFSIPYFGVYSATKAAQNHISRAMKMELEPRGIHVSSVHPVGTKTEFFETAQHLSGDQTILDHTSPMFMQSAETVARAVVRCLRKPKAEVWTSQLIRIGMAVSMLTPRFADMGVRGMVRDYNRRAAAPAAPVEPRKA